MYEGWKRLEHRNDFKNGNSQFAQEVNLEFFHGFERLMDNLLETARSFSFSARLNSASTSKKRHSYEYNLVSLPDQVVHTFNNTILSDWTRIYWRAQNHTQSIQLQDFFIKSAEEFVALSDDLTEYDKNLAILEQCKSAYFAPQLLSVLASQSDTKNGIYLPSNINVMVEGLK